MGANRQKLEIGRRVQDNLAPLISLQQNFYPDRLIPTAYVTQRISDILNVSAAAVRRYLTEAVADETVTEILVRRDWLVMLPEAENLPRLYAVQNRNVYRLVRERPASRGSNGISFLTTPAGYKEFLLRVSVQLEKED